MDPHAEEIRVLKERIRELEKTERELRDIQEHLRDSEEKYRELFELESDAVFLIDNETGRIIDVNPAATLLYGYSREEILTMRNTDFSAEPLKTRAATLTGLTFLPVRYHQKKNGDVFPVEIAASHLLFRGRPAHIAAIRDITARKRAEDLLRESEERYRNFFEEDLTGDIIAKPDGTILLCNSSFARIFGFSSVEDALRVNIGCLFTDKGDMERFLSLLKTRKRIEYHECVRLRYDGTPVSVVENVIGVFDGNGDLVEYKGYIYDDSARKKAEEDFRKTDLLYRMLFEKAGEGIVFIEAEGDGMGTIAAVNETAAAMHGFTVGKAVGGHFTEFISPVSSDDSKQLFQRVKGKNVWIGGESIHLREGEIEFPVEYSAGLIDDGDHKYVLVFLRDISERRIAETKKDELISKLREALAEIKTLRGFIPICSHCKKIRNDSGYWEQIETYLREHADMVFSHGICPECMEKHYSKYLKSNDTRREK